jgi:hypothetical protein
MTPDPPESPGTPDGPDQSILPLGYLGIVAPMNSLGFALNPGIGLVYDEVIALLPAQALVFTFQQHRAADEARRMPYDEAAAREGVRVIRLSDIEKAELVKPFTGHRLMVTLAGDGTQRWILQHTDLDELRQVLGKVLGDRFVDSA